jgi:acetolactate synthase regulatory subunit
LSERAQREADTLVQDAERRAAELVAAGQREVERLSTERARLSEEAQREADTLVQDAQRRAAELAAESQREVERLSNERSRLETLTSEVQEDLSEFLLGTLDRLKQQVGSTTVSDDSAP